MKKALVLLLLGALLLSATPVFAHGGEEGAVDAPTLVRQAIAFLEGTGDTEMAMEKIMEAQEANEEQLVDGTKLEQAIRALDNLKVEESMDFLVEAIGGDPALDLELRPAFQASALNYTILGLAALLIAGGFAVIARKNSPDHGGGNVNGRIQKMA